MLSELLQSNGYLIAALGAESRRRFMDAVNQWEVGWQHQSVLTALLGLDEHGATSQKQLADFVGIDPRNLVAVIDGLEQRHLIERLPNPEDRRSYSIKLTAEGVKLAKQILTMSEQLEADMFACLTTAEKTTLHNILLKLHENMGDDYAFQG
jgi:DNA-binding MarR family transcriptional regulator